MSSAEMRTQLRAWRSASAWRTAWAAFRMRRLPPALWVYPRVHVGLGHDVTVRGPGSLHVGRRWPGRAFLPSELSLAHHARLELLGTFSLYTGCSVAVNEGAVLVLGSGYINHRSCIECFQRIAIGENVAIAKGVTIRDSDAHSIDGGPVSAPIAIGDRVWIGANAIVLKGVTIGDGAVIGAGAIVTRDVPPHALAAGVPARVLKTNVCWA